MEQTTPREYKPTPEEMEVLIQIGEQIRSLQMQSEGCLKMILSQQKLKGSFVWKGDRLVEEETK